jgi:two-component system chemotaxis response regulator CheY
MPRLKLDALSALLVEPSQAQRRIILRLLAQNGVTQVSTANSGGEALQLLQRHGADLLISALYLPDMTGTELVETLKRSSDWSAVPFILISSETRFRYLDPVRQAGAVAILPKPFGARELKTALDTTLEHLDPSLVQLDSFDPESLEVLVVDDSAMARKHIRRVLMDMGLERFTEACDGVQAMRMISERFFDLVVTDYNMPNMDGQELVDHIRQHSNQGAIPVLMVTSEEDESRLAAVQKAGVSAICDKPFEPGAVRQLLVQMMSEAADH